MVIETEVWKDFRSALLISKPRGLKIQVSKAKDMKTRLQTAIACSRKLRKAFYLFPYPKLDHQTIGTATGI